MPPKNPGKIAVTGATGFLGAHVLARLLEDGAEVSVLLRSQSDAWRIRHLLPRTSVLEIDLTDDGALSRALESSRPDFVLHLAWEGVDSGRRHDPKQSANVALTGRVAAAAKAAGARRWLGLGSMAEYGNTSGRISEDHPTRPTTPYGVAKRSANQAALAAFGNGVVWLRLFSLYGPQEGPGWLIPDLMAMLLRGERPPLSAGTQRRDYLFVRDAAAAISCVLHGDAEGIFNLGSGHSVEIRDIAEGVRDLIDPKLPLGLGERSSRPGEPENVEADIRQLSAAFSWTPATSLADGLRETVAWYRANPPTRMRKP